MMKTTALITGLFLTLLLWPLNAWLHAQQAEMSPNQAALAQKQKELKNLQELEKILEDEYGTTMAVMAQSITSTVPKIGYQKTNAQGFVTATGGVEHSPSKSWVLNEDKLRQEYKNAGIYTQDEIDTIVEYHKSYTQNRGFTTEISESLAKLAEAKAQLRTIQKYIERKKLEIKELETPQPVGGAITSSGSDNQEGGGGGGGGY